LAPIHGQIRQQRFYLGNDVMQIAINHIKESIYKYLCDVNIARTQSHHLTASSPRDSRRRECDNTRGVPSVFSHWRVQAGVSVFYHFDNLLDAYQHTFVFDGTQIFGEAVFELCIHAAASSKTITSSRLTSAVPAPSSIAVMSAASSKASIR